MAVEYDDYYATLNESFYQDAEWMMYNYVEHMRNMSRPSPGYQRPQGAAWVIINVVMFLIFPLILGLNAFLLYAVFRNEKMRRDPSKWLVSHTSLCMLVTSFILFTDLFSPAYQLPTFESSPLCPGVKVISVLFWKMIPISTTLVVVERFRVIIQGYEKGNGMGKKAVIITLVAFWLLNITMHITGFVHHQSYYSALFSYDELIPGHLTCYLHDTIILNFYQLIISMLSSITVVIVIIGSIVISCRGSSPAAKRHVIAPTVAVAIIYLLLYKVVYFAEVFIMEFGAAVDMITVILFHVIFLSTWMTFPLIWLIVWSMNSDITWSREVLCPCLPGPHRDEFHMLENE